jgi:hypothetical protein
MLHTRFMKREPHTKLLLLALGLAAVACGVGRVEQPAEDLNVAGVGVKVDTSLAWAHDPTLPGRMERVMDAVEAYAGKSASLRGWVVVLKDAWAECPGAAPHSILGCTEWANKVISVDVNGASCVEQTVLAHEVLHAIVGDACHKSPLWRDFAPVEAALQGEGCEVSADKWRTEPTCN